MTSQRSGAKPLDELTRLVVEPTLFAHGLGEVGLMTSWPWIVGDSYARYTRPLQLLWPPRPAKRNPEAPIAPATLVLRVDGAFALEAQHNAVMIVERVNAHLGWQCVGRIAFRQGPLPPCRENRRALQPPSNAAEAEARQVLAGIGDPALRDALTRFGAYAIDRPPRRSSAAASGAGE